MSAGIQISESAFGKLSDGQLAKKYTLSNRNGFSFSVISLGASLQAINVPDKNNQLVNVALGFDNIQGLRSWLNLNLIMKFVFTLCLIFKEYDSDLNPYLGPIVGRVANRISNGKFTLNGQEYVLEKNNGENNLHSGSTGLHRVTY